MVEMSQGDELTAYQREQIADWSQWEAVEQIWHGNALAYDVGHPVPASNVELHGYDKDGLVRRVGDVTARNSARTRTESE